MDAGAREEGRHRAAGCEGGGRGREPTRAGGLQQLKRQEMNPLPETRRNAAPLNTFISNCGPSER